MTIEDIALTLQPGLGHKGVIHLMSVYGSAEAVFAASAQEIVERCGLRPDIAAALAKKEFHKTAEKEMKLLRQNGLDAVAATDADYPPMLLHCNDYPHVLYFRGDVRVLASRTVSMVGTRTISQYGMRMSNVMVGQLAECVNDAVIVSGLAFGVDEHCHRAALEYGLRTVAVLPCALPSVTPPQNARLAEQIVADGGALISELNSQTRQNGNYYLPRNRIIAGASEGTLVVESPREGGSLYTAEYAYGYERVVMALPGRVGDRCSEGTNRLIRDRKAVMVCSGRDVARELGWDIERIGVIPAKVDDKPLLSADEERLVKCFGEGEELNVSVLAMRSGMSVGEVNALLLGLEIGGVVRSLPGKMYELAGN